MDSNKPSGIKIASIEAESLYSLTPKLICMKTKTMAVSLMLTFFSCSLFAQNQTDTVPQTTPKTDTVPRTDTATTDTSKVSAFVTEPVNVNKVSQNNTAFLEGVSMSSAKEEETVSAK